MNLIDIQKRFDSNIVESIRLEIDSFVKTTMPQSEYDANKSAVDMFFVQPILYAVLVNYASIQEQRATISMLDIYSDSSIQDTKKETFFRAFADEAGIDTDGLSVSEIVSAIENKMTVSESTIRSSAYSIEKEYEYAFSSAVGVSKGMFRNSPDILRFATDKFSSVVISENMKELISVSQIDAQQVQLQDIELSKNISQFGRMPNYIDVLLKPEFETFSINVSLNDGETTEVTFEEGKWATFSATSSDDYSKIKCKSMGNSFIGFSDREIVFEVTGPIDTKIEMKKFKDNRETENAMSSQFPDYDIKFFGAPLLYLTIETRNKNMINTISDKFSSFINGSQFLSDLNTIQSSLSSYQNSITRIHGKLFINPFIYKEIDIFGDSISVGSNSVLSWVELQNSSVFVEEILSMEP